MQPVPARARRVALWSSLIAALLAMGCSPGRLELTSVQFKTIDPPAPRALALDLSEAVWDETEDGRLQIAVRRDATIPLINLRQLVLFSFDLVRLPNGKAREYKMDRKSLRGVAEIGPGSARFESLGGIAAVYRTDNPNQIRCTFRLIANRYTAQLLGGMGKPQRVLLQGEFVATRSTRTAELLGVTEEAGFERTPASQPVRE